MIGKGSLIGMLALTAAALTACSRLGPDAHGSSGPTPTTWSPTAPPSADPRALDWGVIRSSPSAAVEWVCQEGFARGVGPQRAYGDTRYQDFALDRCFHTADGGATWTVHDVPGTGGTYTGRDRDTIDVVSLAAVDGLHAVAIVRTEHVHTGGGHESDEITDLRLVHTADGGTTWTVLRERKPGSDGTPPDLAIPALRMTGQTGTLADFAPGDFERSDDGGATWHASGVVTGG
ncbi:MAG TPA: hypothetical protein VN193_14535 [Candidatus Angelobacter sp.]|jgi:hypothetical protein|nr:hypothetical protein [Candidatus Angelobacter sp.]